MGAGRWEGHPFPSPPIASEFSQPSCPRHSAQTGLCLECSSSRWASRSGCPGPPCCRACSTSPTSPSGTAGSLTGSPTFGPVADPRMGPTPGSTRACAWDPAGTCLPYSADGLLFAHISALLGRSPATQPNTPPSQTKSSTPVPTNPPPPRGFRRDGVWSFFPNLSRASFGPKLGQISGQLFYPNQAKQFGLTLV